MKTSQPLESAAGSPETDDAERTESPADAISAALGTLTMAAEVIAAIVGEASAAGSPETDRRNLAIGACLRHSKVMQELSTMAAIEASSFHDKADSLANGVDYQTVAVWDVDSRPLLDEMADWHRRIIEHFEKSAATARIALAALEEIEE